MQDAPFTRRGVLRAGVLASVGTVGLSGLASARGGRGRGGGGRGFITSRAAALLDNPFTITGPVDNAFWTPTGIAPSCSGNSQPQEHVPYATDRGRWIFFPANRNVTLGVEYEIVTHEDDCGVVIEPNGQPGNRHWIRVVAKPA